MVYCLTGGIALSSLYRFVERIFPQARWMFQIRVPNAESLSSGRGAWKWIKEPKSR